MNLRLRIWNLHLQSSRILHDVYVADATDFDYLPNHLRITAVESFHVTEIFTWADLFKFLEDTKRENAKHNCNGYCKAKFLQLNNNDFYVADKSCRIYEMYWRTDLLAIRKPYLCRYI